MAEDASTAPATREVRRGLAVLVVAFAATLPTVLSRDGALVAMGLGLAGAGLFGLRAVWAAWRSLGERPPWSGRPRTDVGLGLVLVAWPVAVGMAIQAAMPPWWTMYPHPNVPPEVQHLEMGSALALVGAMVGLALLLGRALGATVRAWRRWAVRAAVGAT